MTGCGCLVLLAGIVALIVIFIRGSFDAGEPIDTAALLIAAAALAFQRRQGEGAANQLVGARRA